jgi:hypothetical protein
MEEKKSVLPFRGCTLEYWWAESIANNTKRVQQALEQLVQQADLCDTNTNHIQFQPAILTRRILRAQAMMEEKRQR